MSLSFLPGGIWIRSSEGNAKKAKRNSVPSNGWPSVVRVRDGVLSALHALFFVPEKRSSPYF